MKKNASCKSIRTNLTNFNLGIKPIAKKPLQLDLPSYKNQQSPSNSFRIKTIRYLSPQSHLLKML